MASWGWTRSSGEFLDDIAGLVYGCEVLAQSDDYSGRTLINPTAADEDESGVMSPVRLDRHVIVGANLSIPRGLTPEDGKAVAAMSLVTKTTQQSSFCFGGPAKRIKARRQDLLSQAKFYLGPS